MLKLTSQDPYLVLSESDSMLCINFEFCEERSHKIFKRILIHKAKQFMTTFFFKRSLHILGDIASGVQVGDIIE